MLLDGAHTPSSARALAEVIGELFPDRRPVLVFGVLRDKKVASLAALLFPGAGEVFLVRPPEERGVPPEELMGLLAPRWRRRCRPSEDTGIALAAARKAAGPGGLVVVTGSLFLVGDALRHLPPPAQP